MSQMIIGIIGIILVIAMAVAGTNYLGPRFTEAGAGKNALIVLGSMRQTSDAIAMHRLRSRNSAPDSTLFLQRLLTANILKAAPANPFITTTAPNATTAGAWPYPVFRAAAAAAATLTTSVNRHTHIVMLLAALIHRRWPEGLAGVA